MYTLLYIILKTEKKNKKGTKLSNLTGQRVPPSNISFSARGGQSVVNPKYIVYGRI